MSGLCVWVCVCVQLSPLSQRWWSCLITIVAGCLCFQWTAWCLLPPNPLCWGHGHRGVQSSPAHPPRSSCHNCTWKPAANLLLMGSPYLQIRPYFTSDTESDAFTWPDLLFPLPIILSLAEHCFHHLSLFPCCVWRGPPLLIQRESLSPLDNNNTNLKEIFCAR